MPAPKGKAMHNRNGQLQIVKELLKRDQKRFMGIFFRRLEGIRVPPEIAPDADWMDDPKHKQTNIDDLRKVFLDSLDEFLYPQMPLFYLDCEVSMAGHEASYKEDLAEAQNPSWPFSLLQIPEAKLRII